MKNIFENNINFIQLEIISVKFILHQFNGF